MVSGVNVGPKRGGEGVVTHGGRQPASDRVAVDNKTTNRTWKQSKGGKRKGVSRCSKGIGTNVGLGGRREILKIS